MNTKSKKTKNQVNSLNIFEREELVKKADAIMHSLKAHTWRELEIPGKFDKNAKLTFISDDMLIVGCDIGVRGTSGKQRTARKCQGASEKAAGMKCTATS